jgi:hypothetical protein
VQQVTLRGHTAAHGSSTWQQQLTLSAHGSTWKENDGSSTAAARATPARTMVAGDKERTPYCKRTLQKPSESCRGPRTFAASKKRWRMSDLRCSLKRDATSCTNHCLVSSPGWVGLSWSPAAAAAAAAGGQQQQQQGGGARRYMTGSVSRYA